MKKATVLSTALFLAVFTMASQANTDTTTPAETTAETTAETAEAAESTAAEATEAAAESAAEEPTAPVLSPQVEKLVALYPRLIARIQPRGRVCFQGQECDINISVLAAAVDGQPRDGESIYKAICHTCHDSGLVGAPKLGDAGAWGARLGKGKDTLYHNAINGFNAMPAKGGADIPDEEVKNAVDYIISKSS